VLGRWFLDYTALIALNEGKIGDIIVRDVGAHYANLKRGSALQQASKISA
jgi:hypothetical protein